MNAKNSSYKALVIAGFHRSATSATANYLFNAGLNMGGELMAANINNLKGYFEDVPAVKLHENQFKQAGTNWQFHDETFLDTEEGFIDDYIAKRSRQNSHWGVKDPRICLFLDDWQKALNDNGRYFFVVRHWSSCIESLLNRHSKNLAYGLPEINKDYADIKFWSQPNLAAKMWLSYNKRLIEFAKKHPDKTLISTQRSLFKGVQIIKAINQKFSLDLNENAESPFDKSLFRDISNENIFESISYTLKKELNQVWSEILQIADFKSDNEEPILTRHKEIDNKDLDKIRSMIPSRDDYHCLEQPISTSENTNWLNKLKNITNAKEITNFLNKSKSNGVVGIKPSQWLAHVESVFLSSEHSLSPELTEVLFALTKLLMRLGKYDSAIVILNNRIKISGSSPYIEMFLAQCYQEIKDFDLSNKLFEKAIKAKPNKGVFHTNYAKFLIDYGELDKAEYHFHLAYTLEPMYPACVLGYCRFLDRINNTKDAINLLRTFLNDSSHPMISALLIEFESKVDRELMLNRYLDETKAKIEKANLHQWLAKSCSFLDYRFAEQDLIQRCFQHWESLQNNKKFLGLITRCKDEYFVAEFVNYYLNEGVDKIYIIDDDSNDKNIYNQISNNPKVTVIYEKDIIPKNYASELYKSVKHLYEWMIYIDVDEFIAPKKNNLSTIRYELKTHFADVDCVKIPWIMMSSNNIKKSPPSVLTTNIWRWNHDKTHPSSIHKFRCRYDEIEVKCIFKTAKFDNIADHHPKDGKSDVYIVDSVKNRPDKLNPFHTALREKDISNAILVCHHYRIISEENNQHKLSTNHWYIKQDYQLDDLYSSDHAEIFDNSMSVRQFKNKIFIIGFNRCGTRSLHYFFKNNGLPAVHWDNDNLVKVMESNIKKGNKLLSNGRTINKKVNTDCSYEKAQVFSDITYHPLNKDAKDYYQRLDKDYPNSKFILNIRNVDDWIESRKKHSNGKIVEQLTKFHNCSVEKLESIWRDMWQSSINDIKSYFGSRPNDLLIFDINHDGVEQITSFLETDVTLDPKHYQYVK